MDIQLRLFFVVMMIVELLYMKKLSMYSVDILFWLYGGSEKSC